MDVVSVDDDTPEKLALEYAANVALRLFPPEDGYFRRYVYIKEQKLHGTTNTD